jgi:hypothetical protein
VRWKYVMMHFSFSFSALSVFVHPRTGLRKPAIEFVSPSAALVPSLRCMRSPHFFFSIMVSFYFWKCLLLAFSALHSALNMTAVEFGHSKGVVGWKAGAGFWCGVCRQWVEMFSHIRFKPFVFGADVGFSSLTCFCQSRIFAV